MENIQTVDVVRERAQPRQSAEAVNARGELMSECLLYRRGRAWSTGSLR